MQPMTFGVVADEIDADLERACRAAVDLGAFGGVLTANAPKSKTAAPVCGVDVDAEVSRGSQKVKGCCSISSSSDSAAASACLRTIGSALPLS